MHQWGWTPWHGSPTPAWALLHHCPSPSQPLAASPCPHPEPDRTPLLLGVSSWILVGFSLGTRCHLVPRSQILCWGVPTMVAALGGSSNARKCHSPGRKVLCHCPHLAYGCMGSTSTLGPVLPWQIWGWRHWGGMGLTRRAGNQTHSPAPGGHGGDKPEFLTSASWAQRQPALPLHVGFGGRSAPRDDMVGLSFGMLSPLPLLFPAFSTCTVCSTCERCKLYDSGYVCS